MDQITVDIYWKELSLQTQEQIAEKLGFKVDEVEKEMNWDMFPVTTVYFDKDEINPDK